MCPRARKASTRLAEPRSRRATTAVLDRLAASASIHATARAREWKLPTPHQRPHGPASQAHKVDHIILFLFGIDFRLLDGFGVCLLLSGLQLLSSFEAGGAEEVDAEPAVELSQWLVAREPGARGEDGTTLE